MQERILTQWNTPDGVVERECQEDLRKLKQLEDKLNELTLALSGIRRLLHPREAFNVEQAIRALYPRLKAARIRIEQGGSSHERKQDDEEIEGGEV
ncbi:MAG: hypothetical protein IPJ67_01045 [Candidatus Moraniibacteriota bacterium]|nr:MAG: hypothetical protein IPJ67_01045 [Candidatus Moranbacteria bacterium]